MDAGIWLLDCGNWVALRCESRYLWMRAWRKGAPNGKDETHDERTMQKL